jgi:proline-specific peptidase
MSSSPTTGWAPFDFAGQTFQTHYRIFGDLRSKRPLVALHGGPSIPSAYMEPFTQLVERFGIPVVLYDQFACGESLPKDGPAKKKLDELFKDPSIWTPELFMKELDNLLKHLKIDNDFDLLGQSWGGMLAASFVINYQPPGLKNLIIANSMARMQDWVDSTQKLLDSPEFPRTNRNVIKFVENHPDAESTISTEEYTTLKKSSLGLTSSEYQNSLVVLLKLFVLRIDPWPESWNRALEEMKKTSVLKIMYVRSRPAAFTNPTHLCYRFGPAWCICLGTLRDFDIRKDLHKIKARTLVYNGAYEQAQDFVVKPFVDNIKNSKWVKFEESSHFPHYEELEKCMEVIGTFLLGH